MKPLTGRAAETAATAAEAGHRRFFFALAGGTVVLSAVLLGVVWLAFAYEDWLAPALAVLSLGGWLGMATLVGGLFRVASGQAMRGDRPLSPPQTRLSGRTGGPHPRFWRRVLHGCFPLVEGLARGLGRLPCMERFPGHGLEREGLSPKDRVRHAFIQLNNELVQSEAPRCRPEELLILLPHCLQASHCPMRLTHRLDNCKRCGSCTLRDFLELRDRLGVKLAVAPGGTIARRIVRTNRPQIIVAVACERDLASGIQDCAPLPVFGVLNERPSGPCVDTWVSMARVEAAVNQFVEAPVSA